MIRRSKQQQSKVLNQEKSMRHESALATKRRAPRPCGPRCSSSQAFMDRLDHPLSFPSSLSYGKSPPSRLPPPTNTPTRAAYRSEKSRAERIGARGCRKCGLGGSWGWMSGESRTGTFRTHLQTNDTIYLMA